MLNVESVTVAYGAVSVLHDVSLKVDREVVAVIGPNGAGKSTLLKAISGLHKPRHGSIAFGGMNLAQLSSHSIVDKGVTLVPEGMHVFPRMTVRENLLLGAYNKRAQTQMDASFQLVDRLFPVLQGRYKQLAGTLSGGQQQMLALARGLMARPSILMLDEPSFGLSPLVIKTILEVLRQLKNEGLSMLIAEQNVHMSLDIADRIYLLGSGKVVTSGNSETFRQNPDIVKTYLGV